ncbi:MAG: 4Fe-4S binding protein [Oscillospiraceae bacterium]|nr:4Fe-4S binding protein [Oscillospiraceae bacterium]
MNDKRFVTPLGNDGMYVLDTAAWRTHRPVMDKGKCINCGICMGYCPVNSVYYEDGRFQISYDFCKGCGICAVECPRQAIAMLPEGGK